MKVPLVYKCAAPLAATARSAGWSVIHVADDAVLDVAAYDRTVPARRTLRRKLRASQKAGVRIACGGSAPYDAMQGVDAAWQATHGPARGGSMGRLCPDYIKDQWVACAYQNGTMVAFITAHRGHHDWCLDIMRHGDDVPDGTMHSLVDAAVDAARRAGAEQFCLAATPACPNPHSAFWRRVARYAVTRTGGPGLRQFKSAFAPRWSARYAAAPTPLHLVLGLTDLAREIVDPRALDRTTSNEPHYVDEDYELASRRTA